MNREDKWRKEFESFALCENPNFDFEKSHQGYDNHSCEDMWLGFFAARKKADEEIDALNLSVDAMTSGFCLLEKRHRQFTYELEDELQKQKDEIEKRDRLLDEAKPIMRRYAIVTKVSEWLKQYEEMRGEK